MDGLHICACLALRAARIVADILGMPAAVTQAALLPAAGLKGGELKPARRLPPAEVGYWNRCGEW